ncbi:MAG: GNAT family N-acetyltransferase, partial [Proteobacteria bacterium]|nr:GNAT family N-acetyltransferase [Pseudomonadota bacterium]
PVLESRPTEPGGPGVNREIRVTVEGQARAERVAVLDSHRQRGIGVALMKAIEAEAAADGHHELHLSAQVQVIPFYEKLEYSAYGSVYLDANIEHRMMYRLLSVPTHQH